MVVNELGVDGRTGNGMPFQIRTDSGETPFCIDTVLCYGPETYLKARTPLYGAADN